MYSLSARIPLHYHSLLNTYISMGIENHNYRYSKSHFIRLAIEAAGIHCELGGDMLPIVSDKRKQTLNVAITDDQQQWLIFCTDVWETKRLGVILTGLELLRRFYEALVLG